MDTTIVLYANDKFLKSRSWKKSRRRLRKMKNKLKGMIAKKD